MIDTILVNKEVIKKFSTFIKFSRLANAEDVYKLYNIKNLFKDKGWI